MIRKNLGGRPETQWNEGRPVQAYKLALLGLSEADMAEVMGVSHDTITLWKRTHEDFARQLRRGKREADAEVAHSLYQRAKGFWIDTVEPMIWKGEVFQVAKRKYFPPDSQAALKWLALRHRELWAEVQRIETTQTNINITKIDLSVFSREELELMQKMNLKALVENAGSSQN